VQRRPPARQHFGGPRLRLSGGALALFASAILAAAARGPWPPLLLVSLAGWIVPLASRQWFVVPNFCGASASGWLAGGWSGLELSLLLNPPELPALAWLLMFLAMMPPLLAQPIRHLWDRSLRRRRKRAVALFVAAYAAVWMLAGLVLLVAAILLRALAGAGLLPSLALAIAIALLWQATPAKQTCLNRCHRLPRLSAFGLAADLDCLRYGLVAARWCVATR
jgi:predicted metal-binding membrane protein